MTQHTNRVTTAQIADLRRLLARQLLPVGVAILLVWLLRDRITGLDFARIGSGLNSISAGQWCLAVGFSGLSFWAVGRYDAVIHRIIGSPTGDKAARRSGVAAIAVAQTVGFGVVSGALVRWRMLPQASFVQALRISASVSLSFLAGWAVLAAIATLFLPVVPPGAPLFVGATACGAIVLIGLSLIRPARLGRLALPSLSAMGAILTLTVIDTGAAGAALYVLLPHTAGVSPVTVVAAFLVALGAGLICATPGGVGPFEVSLLALLPSIPEEPLLAAVLGFRLVYYAIPALIGAALLIRGPGHGPGCAPVIRPLRQPGASPALTETIRQAPRAEAALLRHGRLDLLTGPRGDAVAMVAKSGQSLILLSDPLLPRTSSIPVLARLTQAARERFLSPCLYKAGARLAVQARRAGWVTLPVAKEAFLDPGTFTLEGASRRQLRRKLRGAEKAGLRVSRATGPLPVADLEAINRAWVAARGGERGFSMGVFDPATLPWSRLFLAHVSGRLVGFLTLHVGAQEQTLDLMRQLSDAPDGTMHLLVHSAIDCAAREGCRRFSLAAVPLGRQTHEAALFRALRAGLDRIGGATGLRQFKTSFAPQWEVLYLSAPTRLGLVLGVLDVIREIARPRR